MLAGAIVGLPLTAGGALRLAVAPDRASYITAMLPGLLLLAQTSGSSTGRLPSLNVSPFARTTNPMPAGPPFMPLPSE